MRMNPKPTRLKRLTLKPKPPQRRLVVEWRSPKDAREHERIRDPRRLRRAWRGPGRLYSTACQNLQTPRALRASFVVFGAACVNGGAARGRAASPPTGAALRFHTQFPERSAATGLASQRQCIASWRAMRSRRPPRRCPMTAAGPRRKAPALCWTRGWQPPRRIRAVAALRSTATRAAFALRVPQAGCPPTLLRERRASSGARTSRS